MNTLEVNKVSRANPLYIGTKVYIAIYRKRYVLIDVKSNQRWSNDYHKTIEDAMWMIQANEFVLTTKEITIWKPLAD